MINTPMVSSSLMAVDILPATSPRLLSLKYPIFTFLSLSPTISLFSAPKLYEAVFLFLSAKYPQAIFPTTPTSSITATVYTSFITTGLLSNIPSHIFIRIYKTPPSIKLSKNDFSVLNISILVILPDCLPATV